MVSQLQMMKVRIGTLAKFKDMIKELDLVMFTGGADVDPALYGGVHTDISFITPERDRIEQVIFNYCLKYGIKMTGICRGFQFLNVMCGGRMYQHISNHAGVFHNVEYPATGKDVLITSTHHQLVMPPEDAIPVAWSEPNLSDIYIGPDTKYTEGPKHKIESAIYPEYNAFGVQFHPEMMRTMEPGRLYYGQVLLDFLNLEISEFIKSYGYNGENNDEEKHRGEDCQAG